MAVVAGLIAFATPASSQAETIYGLVGNTAGAQSLIAFDSAAPGTATTIGGIAGVQPGERIVGIDVRPANGRLYGISSTGMGGPNGRLYLIDRATAVATQVGSGTFSTPLDASTSFGLDFSSSSDRLRVVSVNKQNLRINPDTGGLAGTDAGIAPAPGQPLPNPFVSAVAIDNNLPPAQPGTGPTTVYAYDSQSNHLARIGSPGGSPVSPNTGQLFDIGSSAIVPGSLVSIGLDISPLGTAYLLATVGGVANLYTVNLNGGGATLIGATTTTVFDIAVAPIAQTIAFDAAAYSANEGAASATVTLTRSQSLGAAFVRLTTADGTATGNGDYTAVDTNVVFAPGELTQQVEIPLLDDSAFEGPETLTAALSAPSGEDASLASPSTATITIDENDSPPDTTTPTTSLEGLPRRIAVAKLLRKGLNASATPSEASALTFTLLGKPRPAGRSPRAFSATLASVQLPLAGGKRSATLKPKRRQLRRVKQRSVRVTVLATDGAGNTGTAGKTVRLKRPRR